MLLTNLGTINKKKNSAFLTHWFRLEKIIKVLDKNIYFLSLHCHYAVAYSHKKFLQIF